MLLASFVSQKIWYGFSTQNDIFMNINSQSYSNFASWFTSVTNNNLLHVSSKLGHAIMCPTRKESHDFECSSKEEIRKTDITVMNVSVTIIL